MHDIEQREDDDRLLLDEDAEYYIDLRIRAMIREIDMDIYPEDVEAA